FLLKATSDPDYRIEVDSSEDWPAPGSLPSWTELLDALRSSQSEILDLLSARDDLWLQQTVPGATYSFGMLVRGVVQHDIYHLGQIGLLLRMLREQS
ncbi:MAG: DinB family protein, partial [Saprospiraceae bacterium]|nr:DinB family protein [Saprospiraceae bacterium]